jgi:ribosomal protein S18 acetylase RimI-like enzyme
MNLDIRFYDESLLECSQMKIRTVQNRRDLRRFIQFPYQLYRDDPLWVPPLWSEQWAQFDPRKNPMLDHCDTVFFLLEEGGEVIGRCSAFIDSLAVDYWQKPVGLFGSFECIEDEAAAHQLLSAAKDWLSSRGMTAMRGPWSFASQEWGLEIEGGSRPPVILAPHHPTSYAGFFDSFGLEKAMDLLAYLADMGDGYQIPERYLTLTDRIQARYGVSVRPVNLSDLEADVMTIVDLSNRSIADNWGYYPVTMDEARTMARDLKQIVNPEALLIAEDRHGEPIGFALSLPDVNTLLSGLNGRLFPFGWLKMLTGLKKIRQYRMWGLGVVPEYQGKAIDTLLYRATYEALKDLPVCMEINYVLENNHRMNNALLKLGVTPIRRYRVYEMAIG